MLMTSAKSINTLTKRVNPKKIIVFDTLYSSSDFSSTQIPTYIWFSYFGYLATVSLLHWAESSKKVSRSIYFIVIDAHDGSPQCGVVPL